MSALGLQRKGPTTFVKTVSSGWILEGGVVEQGGTVPFTLGTLPGQGLCLCATS